MFCASLLGVFDAALDFLIGALKLPANVTPAWSFLFALGWLINLMAVVLAIQSMESFLPLLFHPYLPDQSESNPQQ